MSEQNLFLSQLALRVTDLQSTIQQLLNLYQTKLWHQLTVAVEEFVRSPYFEANKHELPLVYHNFVKDFESRINPRKLVQLAAFIAESFEDPAKSLEFLELISSKNEVRADDAAKCLCSNALALILMRMGQDDKVKASLEASKALLDGPVTFEPIVYSSFYRASMAYHQAKGTASEFYHDSLKYLSYTPLTDIPATTAPRLAFDIGVAALLGDNIYNFGELLAHPVLASLDNTQFSWMRLFLQAFNTGNIAEYNALRERYGASVASLTPQLCEPATIEKMREKISILCLMEIVFRRPSSDRTIPFGVIASEARIEMHEVEFLLMKALSLKVVEGVIDEVAQIVQITWVQPRVLNLEQIGGISARIGEWAKKVQSTLRDVESDTQELLVE
eukprot:gnl/Spiro4/3784_TR1864_c0_g1_i1.p1 gnl/Spiro4/3784_TR1864_c0_g1~~gnl/Spiro4/3784_TR1864_c0_g1_i1.p1  ORF type:complete len:417 (-),score=88.97 gnl/Spiro4/3784_TR1864_c0_g1_i1:126-1292(-)